MRQGVALRGGNWRAGGWPRGRAGMVCGVAPLALAAGVIVPLAALCRAQESGSAPVAMPLHERIDRLIETQLERGLPGPNRAPAAPATDSEFLRRVWLDLAGVIPPAEEARAFLDDPSPYKRARLIDRLLESPLHARRMQQVFDTLWMERRPDLHVPAPAWRAFLYQAFNENQPYDELVRAVLGADGTDPRTRGAARFSLDREADPHTLARDVGRLFLGVDLTCCQCHDHPLIDGYKQAYYYGLFAFLNRTVLVTEPAAGGAVLGEKAEGDVQFASVFKKKVIRRTGPRVLDGPPLPEPKIPAGQEYLVPPDKDGKVRPVPVSGRRNRLAASIASSDVPAFSRNVVNRIWALLLGRGIVHPVDLHHPDNPPSHPELLDLLAREFVAMKFDLRAFLRELTLTRAYQRSSEAPPDSSPGLDDPAGFAVAALRPLSPEQLAWSTMQGLGIVAATRALVIHQLEDHDPRIREILAGDPKRRALRVRLVEDSVYGKLEPSVGPFVRLFGGVAGQPQTGSEGSSTVDQALFITNGEPIRSWLNPQGGFLVERLMALPDSSSVAELLYLSLLSRRPTSEERAEAAGYLARRTREQPRERTSALRELVWSLIASTEFRFNH
ncbi:MAG: DUF1549 domain-containing protein [Isosphaeraceae bacterium]